MRVLEESLTLALEITLERNEFLVSKLECKKEACNSPAAKICNVARLGSARLGPSDNTIPLPAAVTAPGDAVSLTISA